MGSDVPSHGYYEGIQIMHIVFAAVAITFGLTAITQAQVAVGPIPQPPTMGASPSAGATVGTPRGSDTSVGGTQSYQQLSGPSGGGGISIPNSNGTSTITSPSGAIQTVPTPR